MLGDKFPSPRIPGLSPSSHFFFLNVCFSAFIVGVLSLLSGLRLQDTDLDPKDLGAYILDGIWSLCFLLVSTWL